MAPHRMYMAAIGVLGRGGGPFSIDAWEGCMDGDELWFRAGITGGASGAWGTVCAGDDSLATVFNTFKEYGNFAGHGKFFLAIQTIKCIAMANSSLSNLLSTGFVSTMFQISRKFSVDTSDFENRATASAP